MKQEFMIVGCAFTGNATQSKIIILVQTASNIFSSFSRLLTIVIMFKICIFLQVVGT